MQFQRLTTKDQVRRFASDLPNIVAVDTEYTELDVKKATLLDVAIATSEENGFLIGPGMVHLLEPLKNCKAIFYQNHVVDLYVLAKHGLDLWGVRAFDTMLLEHLINEDLSHSLGDMVLRYFNDNYKDEFWKKYEKYEDAPEHEALEYSLKDSIYTFRLVKKFLGQLRGKDDLIHHVHELAKALFETEIRGLRVNEELIRNTKVTMGAEIESYLPKLRSDFRDYCDLFELTKWQTELVKRKTDKGRLGVRRPQFSFGSDTQLRWLIYDALKCPVIEKTKNGNPATDFDTLELLSQEHPELNTLVQYKGAKAVYATFVDGLLDRVQDGRIFPRFQVNGTKTGRISSNSPNLQNMPKEGVIRNFFIPDDGHKIIGADYSQLEVIVELNLTDDPGLKEIVLGGASKHDLFMEELHKAGFPLPRWQVKNINFALQYRGQAKKIAKMVGCSVSEGQRIIDVFNKKFSGVKSLQDQTDALVVRDWQVTNLAGRTRHFEPTKNPYLLGKYQRQAYNFLIQGVAAEACNRAFHRYAKVLKAEGWGSTMHPVHDEIVAQVRDHVTDEAKQRLVDVMEASSKDFNFRYPLKSQPYGPFSFWQKA